MKIQLIRNATLRLHYGGHQLLIDPYFAPKFSRPSYAGNSPNPLVDLPISVEEIMSDVELVLVSHLHSDHFDPEAQRLLPKELPILCQPGDETSIQSRGFQDVTPVVDKVQWDNLTITRTPGQHGEGAVLDDMGHVSGFVFQAADELTLYWAGDTIWYEGTQATIEAFHPAIIVTHSSGATWEGSGPIVMDAAQTVELCRTAPDATVVAVHMDSLDHGQVSRTELRDFANAAGISELQLLIPADGHSLEWDSSGERSLR